MVLQLTGVQFSQACKQHRPVLLLLLKVKALSAIRGDMHSDRHLVIFVKHGTPLLHFVLENQFQTGRYPKQKNFWGTSCGKTTVWIQN